MAFISLPMLCSFGQSANDHIGRINITSPESNIAFSLYGYNFKWSGSYDGQFPLLKPKIFSLLRKCDAIHFEVISAMEASNGADSVYSMTDNTVGDGALSYRIRITGKDGQGAVQNSQCEFCFGC
jgi:hypothetical protein